MLLRRLRFTELVLLDRFAEAVAAWGEAKPEPRYYLWALYRLGCYRSVLERAGQAGSAHDLVALAISSAACGYKSEAEDCMQRALSRRGMPRLLLAHAARSFAAFHLPLAEKLAERLGGNAGLRAAILLADNRPAEALALTGPALSAGERSAGRFDGDPDLLLLHANALGRAEAILPLINRYLAAYGLSPVEAADPARPPSPSNLKGAGRAECVRGPLVSVIMPTYNGAKWIRAALASLLAQTYVDTEILVADDASTDATAGIVREMAARDSRIRLLQLSLNSGPYVARNLALGQARGQFVTCHDSDDWAHPQRIALQVGALLRRPERVFSTSRWVRVQEDGLFYARSVYPLTRLNPASPLFRRQPILDRAGVYDTARTGADSEFTDRLKVVFGLKAWHRMSQPLAFGAHRSGSLMTDPQTGIARGTTNPERLAYWESWVWRHIDILSRRAKNG